MWTAAAAVVVALTLLGHPSMGQVPYVWNSVDYNKWHSLVDEATSKRDSSQYYDATTSDSGGGSSNRRQGVTLNNIRTRILDFLSLNLPSLPPGVSNMEAVSVLGVSQLQQQSSESFSTSDLQIRSFPDQIINIDFNNLCYRPLVLRDCWALATSIWRSV